MFTELLNQHIISSLPTFLSGGIIGISSKIIYDYFKLKPDVKSTTIVEPKIQLNPNEFINIKKSIDVIIEEKFKFYMFNKFLPYYTVGKKPDKNDVDEIKEQFYIDVTITFTKEYKKLIKKYFTSDGIQLYINEKFLYHLNKLDSKFYEPRESKTPDDTMPIV